VIILSPYPAPRGMKWEEIRKRKRGKDEEEEGMIGNDI